MSALDLGLLTLLRSADNAASIAHDFIYGRNGVSKEQADAAIWAIHNALRPLFEDDPEPSGTGEHGYIGGERRKKLAERAAALAHDRRWSDCPKCAAFYDENRDAVIHAAASVGIERGLTTNVALALYMKEKHGEHA